MNPIHTLINDTLALDEKATAGPFETHNASSWVEGEIWIYAPVKSTTVSIAAVRRGCGEAGGRKQNEADAKMFAAFRSSAPRLARIAKIAVEALETLREHRQKMEFDDGDIDQSDFCANALAAIEREAGK